MPTHNAGVSSSNHTRVTIETRLARKATGNHLMNSTSLEKLQIPASGFCDARNRACDAVMHLNNTDAALHLNNTDAALHLNTSDAVMHLKNYVGHPHTELKIKRKKIETRTVVEYHINAVRKS